MALVHCSECTAEISAAATACPRCGHPNARATEPPVKRSHAGGWLAVGSLVLASFTPAILSPILLLAAFAFTAKEFARGSKVFGSVVLVLSLLQGWAVMEHFGQVSSALGLRTAQDTTAQAVNKYESVSLDLPSDWKTIAATKCREDWPSDYRMQEHCQKGQAEAAVTLSNGARAGVDPSAFRIIRGKCAEEWPRDFKMRAHCEGRQSDGFLAIGGSSSPKRDRCAQQWPDDFTMRRHCETR